LWKRIDFLFGLFGLLALFGLFGLFGPSGLLSLFLSDFCSDFVLQMTNGYSLFLKMHILCDFFAEIFAQK